MSLSMAVKAVDRSSSCRVKKRERKNETTLRITPQRPWLSDFGSKGTILTASEWELHYATAEVTNPVSIAHNMEAASSWPTSAPYLGAR